MRQPASIEPFIPSPDTQVPHPVLRAALDNLDVNLEEELIRYRRQQRLQSEPYGRRKAVAPPRLNRIPTRPTQDGIRLPNVREAFHLHTTGEFPIGNSAASENPVRTLFGTTADAASQAIEPPAIEPPPLPQFPNEGIASYAQQIELSTHEPNAALQKLIQDNLSASTAASEAPEDYLESSEELLKSIQEETSSQRAQRRPDLLDTLLTPLGIGSMLLLLLSSTTLGFVIMNPSVLGVFFAPTASTPSPSPLTKVPTTPIDVAPPSPNLAAEEFKDLNLDTLSTLPGSAKRPSAAPSKPAANQPSSRANDRSTSPATGAIAPSDSRSQPQTYVEPAPQPELPAIAVESNPPIVEAPSAEAPVRSVAPAPAPQAAPPAAPSPEKTAVRPASPSESLYYVGTDYSSDSSLQQARQSVPDAYVRNLPGGAKVQLGAFTSEAAAQERVQELQQQGISAQVYKP
ncbi:MAG: SPOR domain-containing protein [Drouetiella hepatica Uher 2000/2452]|uniref:SPOR domain-containing protein n=1 Tax=Drouetiella hepatica Uher 2000/2452 TaxID=904376 RepID=A0A951Q8G2_9CYAN|nr:SPOR domain-containing protein [Drouetiella hepatica Uher 2000/2452]